ncbi:hypothetical protein [Pantoea sp. B65]|uniref:hypothetical protein n=1 Tax=Pantoea sp. B65 TaxID=2813359 RepID=UPI0039B53D78
MQLDLTHFPVVWMKLAESAEASAAESPFSAFESLLDRQTPFVFINDEGLDVKPHNHSKEEMQRVAQWRKDHRQALKRYVSGAIYIEPDSHKRLAVTDFAITYEKFWGYEMFVVASREEALALANKLLSLAGSV